MKLRWVLRFPGTGSLGCTITSSCYRFCQLPQNHSFVWPRTVGAFNRSDKPTKPNEGTDIWYSYQNDIIPEYPIYLFLYLAQPNHSIYIYICVFFSGQPRIRLPVGQIMQINCMTFQNQFPIYCTVFVTVKGIDINDIQSSNY